MKALRPAFMVTAVVAVACSSDTTNNPPGPRNALGSGSAVVSATAAAPSASLPASASAATPTLRKRVGKRSKAAERKQAPGSYRSLHPVDKDGRRIDLANDDSCYVVVPKTTPRPKDLNTGERWTENVAVDCPAELDDAAWDTLQAGEFLGWDEKTGACAFVPEFGNPPPPPVEAGCPKTLPKKK
jgi:hypothetical protein